MKGLGDDATALILAAEGADDPSTTDDARTRAALSRRLGAGVGLAACTTASATAAAAGTTTAAAVTTGASVGVVAKALVAVALVGATSVAVVRSSYEGDAPVTRAVPSAAAATQAPAPLLSTARPLTRAAPSPSVPPAAMTTQRAPSKPAPPPPSPSPPSPSPPPPPVVVASPRAHDSLEDETHCLREADDALRARDGKAALARLDDHARRFPNGLLAEEREAQRVLALCELGRVDEASRAAAAFLSAHPRSPMAPRLRRSCDAP